MGVVLPEEARNGLIGAWRFFSWNVNMFTNISNCTIFELYFILYITATYLYSKYFRCGENRHGAYNIFAEDIRGLYISYDSDMADYVHGLILSRNKAAHTQYTQYVDSMVKHTVCSEYFIKLLRYEGIIDKDGLFINYECGEYYSVSGREEALENIKTMVAKVNAEDAETAKQDTSCVPSGIAAAIIKMQGE